MKVSRIFQHVKPGLDEIFSNILTACLQQCLAKEHFGFWPKYNIKSGLENTYRWWSKERGLERIRFKPGELGHDVDLAYENEVIISNS